MIDWWLHSLAHTLTHSHSHTHSHTHTRMMHASVYVQQLYEQGHTHVFTQMHV